MEVKEKIVEEREKIRRFCDDCGEELFWSMGCSHRTCYICGKQLCNRCIAWSEDYGGDYPTCRCKSCESIVQKYQPELDSLQDKIDKLWDHMKNECVDKRRSEMNGTEL